MEKENRFWLVKGGTWNERWLGLFYVMLLAALGLALYSLSWALAPYF